MNRFTDGIFSNVYLVKCGSNLCQVASTCNSFSKPPLFLMFFPRHNRVETHLKSPTLQSPFYSAPSIFAVFRNLVQEIWFEKSGSANSDFFSGSRKVVDQKKGGLYYKSTFFQVGEKWFCKLRFFFWFEKSG